MARPPSRPQRRRGDGPAGHVAGALERFPLGCSRSDERSVIRHGRAVGLRLRLTRPTRLHIMVNCSRNRRRSWASPSQHPRSGGFSIRCVDHPAPPLASPTSARGGGRLTGLIPGGAADTGHRVKRGCRWVTGPPVSRAVPWRRSTPGDTPTGHGTPPGSALGPAPLEWRAAPDAQDQRPPVRAEPVLSPAEGRSEVEAGRPDHVRHDGGGTAGLQPNVKRSSLLAGPAPARP